MKGIRVSVENGKANRIMRIIFLLSILVSVTSLRAQWSIDVIAGKAAWRNTVNLDGPCDLSQTQGLINYPYRAPNTSYKETLKTANSLAMGANYRLKNHLFGIGLERHWVQVNLESYIDPSIPKSDLRCDTVGLNYVYRRGSGYIPLRYAYRFIHNESYGIEAQLSFALHLTTYYKTHAAKLMGHEDFDIKTFSTVAPNYVSLSLRPYVSLSQNNNVLLTGGVTIMGVGRFSSKWDQYYKDFMPRWGKIENANYLYFDAGLRVLLGKQKSK